MGRPNHIPAAETQNVSELGTHRFPRTSRTRTTVLKVVQLRA